MTLDSVFNDDWGEDHKSGIVAVVGRPNAGKSTLINAILGQKIAITSPKPQTTRRNQLGIYSTEDVQILFTDTPGLHDPHNKLSEFMQITAEHALKDADAILFIVDVSLSPIREDEEIAQKVQDFAGDTPIILALNKTDIDARVPDIVAYEELIEYKKSVQISALNGGGVQRLVDELIELMPLGPRYYPMEQVSDMNMRWIAAEVVREKVMLHTEQEIPHSVAVGVFDYKDKEQRTDIYANIYVERDSQKGIVIGKRGSMIKKIGTDARKELQGMLERPIFLDLHVKVQKNWRSDEAFMKRIGYSLPKDDD